jgi:hypothetical protein
MIVGATNDLDTFKINNAASNPQAGALIDNLKDDIANRPVGQADAGSLV